MRDTVHDLVEAAQPKVEAGARAARRGGRRARRRAGEVADKAKAKLDS